MHSIPVLLHASTPCQESVSFCKLWNRVEHVFLDVFLSVWEPIEEVSIDELIADHCK